MEKNKNGVAFIAAQMMPTIGKDNLYSFNDAAELLGIRKVQLRRAVALGYIVPDVNEDLDSRFSKSVLQKYAIRYARLAPCLSAQLEAVA